MANLVKRELFSFSIKDYYIEHQGTAILDIDITLEFKQPKRKRKPEDYYEFQQIINYINNYLVDYPNETDYWEILNTNLATSLITDKIPTIWDTTYKLAKTVAELTVDIQVHPGSGGPAYARSSTVTVQAPNKKDDSETDPATVVNSFGTHAEQGRLRPIRSGRAQLTLSGIDSVDWIHPLDQSSARRWNGRRLARHWNDLFGSTTPRAQASFHRDGADTIAFIDVIQTRAGQRSDQLKLTIEGVRAKDQSMLAASADAQFTDIVLFVGEQHTGKTNSSLRTTEVDWLQGEAILGRSPEVQAF